jgi:hypothetical protein
MAIRRTITQADRNLARARREAYLGRLAGGAYVAPASRAHSRRIETRRTYPRSRATR